MYDNKAKKKAMTTVSGVAGVDSIDINMKDQKLTVTGAMDPVEVVGKLRKTIHAKIISVGPAREAQKKDDNKSNMNERSKDQVAGPAKAYQGYYPPPPLPPYYHVPREETPSCVIC